MVEKQEKVPDLREPKRAGQTVTIPDGYLTREDVELLRDWDVAEHAWSSEEPEQRSAMAAHLAAKLAALLPPEDVRMEVRGPLGIAGNVTMKDLPHIAGNVTIRPPEDVK